MYRRRPLRHVLLLQVLPVNNPTPARRSLAHYIGYSMAAPARQAPASRALPGACQRPMPLWAAGSNACLGRCCSACCRFYRQRTC